MHEANHPRTVHLCGDVWEYNPRDVVDGPVGLLWASPDCKHFVREQRLAADGGGDHPGEPCRSRRGGSVSTELRIEPQTEGKGRSFRATLVSYIEAPHLWARGNDTVRPIHMTLAGSDNELRPFVANLRTGKKATVGDRGRQRFEVLKSAGFQCAWQRTAKGSLVTLFAPDLFCLDPGMVDPKGVSFVLLPARSWLRPSDVQVPDCVPEERVADVRALAPLFIAYLDRRTRCPLIPDARFYAQVLANALDQGLASWSGGWQREWGTSGNFVEVDTADAGYAPAVLFNASHETLEDFLAEQVRTYFGATEEKAA
jgi:hypothetical protein